MAATTFTWIASYPATQISQPRVRRVQFGDGYEQRLRYGLNTDLKQWDLVFENRTDSERTEITSFLSARGAVEPFNWTTPFGATNAYVCDEWQAEHAGYNRNTITARFRRVIDI
jgi:phage-related protein